MDIPDKISKFFSKKKVDKEFKKAGPGRKLTDNSSSSQRTKRSTDVYVPIKRDDLTHEAKTARDAALARMSQQSGPSNFSLKAIREQARKELEEQKNASHVESSVRDLNIASASNEYSVEGVFFKCPLISEEILPKREWKDKIKTFLYDQFSSDPGHTACLIIKNCNVIDKAEDCIETLKKYIANITANPSETKYHKIRMSNRIFCEKVANVEGSIEFLKAAGFNEVSCDGDKFLIWSQEFPLEMLIQLTEALDLCEIIQLELDRNVKVLLPSQADKVSLPPDFFRLTKEELMNEQKSKTQAIEEAQILKTKAMREKEQERYVNRFKYTLIRIRFPDGLFLQGTFGVNEKLAEVFDFVIGCLDDETAEFSLISPDNSKFSIEDSEQTLGALRLVPNSVLKFSYENESKQHQEYLKKEYLLLVQSI